MKKFFQNLFKSSKETAEKISESEKVKDAVYKARDFAEDVAEKAVEFAEDLGDKMKSAADKAMENERVRNAVHKAQDIAEDVVDKAKDVADKAMENETVKKAVDKVVETKDKIIESDIVKNTMGTAKAGAETVEEKTDSFVEKMKGEDEEIATDTASEASGTTKPDEKSDNAPEEHPQNDTPNKNTLDISSEEE